MADRGGEDDRRAADRPRSPRPTTPTAFRDVPAADLPEFLTGQLRRVDDPTPPEREVDPELLSSLLELGIDEERAREAIREDRVSLVLSQVLLDDRGKFTVEEVAKLSGVEPDHLRLLRSALGLPIEERWTSLDVQWAKRIATLLEVLSLDAVVRSARARGSALAAVAMGDMSVVRDELIVPLRQAGADDLTVGIALAEATKAINPISEELLVTTYSLQLRHLLSTELAATAARGEASQIRAAVGFVDIVGYTRLSARVDPIGLDTLIDDFESRVIEVTSDRRDVAVVKYLGDAVMLVGPDAVTLADAMLELTTEVEALADSPVRGGMASGDLLARDGDYFGPAVNVAARLTDIARPWRVLVAEEDVAEVRRAFKVDRIRPMRLRGIGTSRPGAVRRPLDEDELAEVRLREDYEGAIEDSASSA